MFFRKRKHTSNDNTPAQVSPTYIGKNTTIDGAITTDGEIHVDGLVRGSISAQICVIDVNGVVEGEVSAEQIIVRGRVMGPLRGVHVHLQDGAHVEGDIQNETIAVDNGAHLHGSVWQSTDPLGTTNATEQQEREPTGFLSSPLWSSPDDDGFRPLKTVRPPR
jgi:cytoskeletal protein CcmA (bactofilin family)